MIKNMHSVITVFPILLLSIFRRAASAQYAAGGKDGFFNDWTDLDNGLDRTDPLQMPELPGAHGMNTNQAAPFGSGLLVLTALGAGYMVAKRKREE